MSKNDHIDIHIASDRDMNLAFINAWPFSLPCYHRPNMNPPSGENLTLLIGDY